MAMNGKSRWRIGSADELVDAGVRSLMLHPFGRSGRGPTAQQREMFYLACYDLDRFRRFIFGTRLLQKFQVDGTRIEAIAWDDEELLKFAIQWLRFTVFGERTPKPKPQIARRWDHAGPRSRMNTRLQQGPPRMTDGPPVPSRASPPAGQKVNPEYWPYSVVSL